MADTFSRDSLAEYEKAPATTVPNDKNPFDGATPSKTATAAEEEAAVAGQPPPPAEPTGEEDAAASEDQPVADSDGTSDENADSSTADVDHADEATSTDESGGEPAPKKGSARERIVELNDLLEGTKLWAKNKTAAQQARILELEDELQRLQSTESARPATPPPSATEEKADPMPRMEDGDVNFDPDLLQAKLEAWIDRRAERATQRAVAKNATVTAQQNLERGVAEKVKTFAKDHADFHTVVTNNRVLKANQLDPAAGLAIARSEHTAEILYRFGKDTDMAVKVARMDPVDQVLFIGEMVKDIKTEKSGNPPPPKEGGKNPQGDPKPPAKKSITKAPPPPQRTPAGGRPQERDESDPAMSIDEFARLHRDRKQIARSENRRQRGLK